MPGYPAGMANPRRFRILVALLCLGIAFTAFAWGRQGHALVGDLAERHLDPTAKAEIARLLAGETDPTLAGVASWADDLRDSDPARFKATSKWHYINAKGGGCGFDLARDCPDGNCVVGAIEAQRAILADRSQPIEARRDALKFIVHLIGDAHQPMHAGSRTDAGGNGFQVSLRTPIEPAVPGPTAAGCALATSSPSSTVQCWATPQAAPSAVPVSVQRPAPCFINACDEWGGGRGEEGGGRKVHGLYRLKEWKSVIRCYECSASRLPSPSPTSNSATASAARAEASWRNA